MLSKVEGRKKISEVSDNGKLLNEIEALSKALYLDKKGPRSLKSTVSSRSKSVGRTHMPEPKSKPKDINENAVEKDKKSIWSWKSLKALTNVRNRRFNCCFHLDVHSIEGLPPSFDDLRLHVNWKRRDGEVVTRSARVVQGVAEFEERLTHICSIYGSRSGPHHSAKYEAKHFLLYASVLDAPTLDLGKHRVDLTRLLPLTLEELEEEKSSGKWTTSYKLLGKAKGATINVSFGYSVLGNTCPTTQTNYPGAPQNSTTMVKSTSKLSQSNDENRIRRPGSLPKRSLTSSSSVEDVKDLHEVLPISRSELSHSVNVLYQKLDEEKFSVSVDYKPEVGVLSDLDHLSTPAACFVAGKENIEGCEADEFSIIDRGVEWSSNEVVKPDEEAANYFSIGNSDLVLKDSMVGLDLKGEIPVDGSQKDDFVASDANSRGSDVCTKELIMKELESALNDVSDLVKEGLDSPGYETELSNTDSCLQDEMSSKRKGKSLSWDDVTESVASEFLHLLGIEHSPYGLSSESDPESPRERLLRQFEEDVLAQGCALLNLGVDSNQADFGFDAPSGSGWANFSEDFGQSPRLQEISNEGTTNKAKASMLEDLETDALMREWGLNEKAFQYSSSNSSNGFGSPIALPPEDPVPLPPLGDGLGPCLKTKNGGFLRSMNTALFRNAKSGGSLIMQVSSPVVVPAEMGSGITEILQRLASVGIEKLSMQASKLMPLEDITGKTMQQMTWETASSLEASERQPLLQQSENGENLSNGQKISEQTYKSISSKFESSGKEMDSEYVNLEDLAPLAMDKIEALSVEGLRIQSGMSDGDAPSNITPESFGEFSTLKGKMVNVGASLGIEGAGGLQLLDIKDSVDDVDGLMGLSLTLDEWMRLDSGEIDDEDLISDRTSKILAAHNATCNDFIRGRSKGDKRRSRGVNRKYGLLGKNFTVALMVQLHDPLRNYESVGAPMLALIQVERVFIPPKPKIYSTVSELRNSNEEDDESEPVKKDINKNSKDDIVSEEESIPQFKITEVHVAGLKTDPGKKKLWGSTAQQQSGSRWLLANGMGKKNKHPLMKSKTAAKSTFSAATTTVQPGDSLWSISSRSHGTGAKWKELAALNPHIRNPNVIFSNETSRLR